MEFTKRSVADALRAGNEAVHEMHCARLALLNL